MSNFFKNVWRTLTFPFVLLYRIILFPFQIPSRVWKFLNTDPDETSEKTLIDHVEDFRAHLLWILIVIALAVGVSFYFTIPLMEYLAKPVGGLAKLQAIEVTEEIGVYMRVALTSGLTISIPFIAFGFWRFAATGLKAREKKFSLLAIP
ncbi:MAG TPA: twin-arginine translocase subunit TatC, partial [Anaerolineales bacterium]|nr:twin-arginine translocase subunit TatC [Anaerolineales bacterium]